MTMRFLPQLRLLCLLLGCLLAGPASALEHVTLQLKYLHQFQFAGYYAAQEKGYYRDAGLDVTIREAADGNEPERRVLAGKAEYGVGASNLLLARAAGKPLVVLGVIFQHSPYVLAVAENGPVKDVHDLIGRTAMVGSMRDDSNQSDELLAYLNKAGVPLERVRRMEHTFNPADLIDGRVDAMSAYSTNEPEFYRKAGFAYRLLSPRDAGIDFYGDNLFTSEHEVIEHAGRTAAFRAASLRGWQYAMTHPEEIADLIVARYSKRNTREHLLFEAREMVPLVQPMLVETGYMNPMRWRAIADTYAALGMLPPDFRLDGFLYEGPPANPWLNRFWAALAVLAGLASLLHFRRLAVERRAVQRQIRDSEQRWNFALEGAGYGVWDWDIASGVVLYSKRWHEIHGYPDGAIPPTFDAGRALIHPEDRAGCQHALDEHFAGRSPAYAHAYRAQTRAGGYIWVMDRGMIVNRDAQGRPLRMICTHADITERKRTEQALEHQSAELQAQAAFMNAVVENIPIALFVKDVRDDFRFTLWNRAAEEIFGLGKERVVGQTDRALWPAEVAHEFGLADRKVVLERRRVDVAEEAVDTATRGIRRLQTIKVPLIDPVTQQADYLLGICEDITEKKASEALIWQQANFDALTQLPNRRMFRDRLEQAMVRSRRDQAPLALLFIDLDRFKEVNDTLGHAMGDLLLVEAAHRIRASVREGDTVARLGGDEFTVILQELSGAAPVGAVAQNIITALGAPFALGDELAFVSASIGITLYPDDAAEIDSLLKNADQALYAAKDAGRNRYSYFTPAMQIGAQNRMRLTNDLRAALNNDELRIFFQPVVNLRTGAIEKAEALVRWQHPQRGMVSPAEFIPLAEASGLIVDIGEWMFRQAAHWAQRWRIRVNADFQVSINQSPLEFQRDGKSYARWLSHLDSLGLQGQAMVVEITEGLLLDASTAVTDCLQALREAGIQVALDDFGTGYSSLSYLKKFNIDYLKIDQSFTRNLAPGSPDMALSEAIIVMAHKLGLKVIAEGVETAQQLHLLREAGCDHAQGYLFSRPIPVQEFDALLLSGQVLPVTEAA
jgi:diguanylate cyclase (GGDEF)-like protein/PAS domain S-box-containing protein